MPVLHQIKKARRRRDRYETDPRLARAAVGLLPDSLYPWGGVLDAGAGTGVWGQAAYAKYPAVCVDGVELGTEPVPNGYWGYRYGDFLTMPFYDTYDLIVSNPPFNLAEQFIARSIELLNPGGAMVFLLPVSFLGSQGRGRGLWQRHPAYEVHICVERPSFYWSYDTEGNLHSMGETDAMEYAIYIWRKGYRGSPTLHWLDWSSANSALAEQRKAA